MDIFDRILETLELERELGTRTVEIDRALLTPPPAPAAAPVCATPASAASAVPAATRTPASAAPAVPAASPAASAVAASASAASASKAVDFAFWTGAPLSPAGDALLGKMIAAMGYARENVLVNREGAAKVVVLLGSGALTARAPGTKAARGAWIRLGDTPAVVTYSPDFILKTYPEGSEGMTRAKREVWNTLKSALARLPR